MHDDQCDPHAARELREFILYASAHQLGRLAAMPEADGDVILCVECDSPGTQLPAGDLTAACSYTILSRSGFVHDSGHILAEDIEQQLRRPAPRGTIYVLVLAAGGALLGPVDRPLGAARMSANRTGRDEEGIRVASAHHEAAHAVAMFVFGHEIAYVTINLDGDNAGEATPIDHPLADGATAAEVENVIIELLAGEAGALASGRLTPFLARRQAADDYYWSKRYVALLERDHTAQGELLEELRARAAHFVKRHWHSIRVLASDLLEHDYLQGEEVELIIMASRGDADAERDLAAYRAMAAVAR